MPDRAPVAATRDDAAVAGTAPEAPAIEHDGQSFTLANRTATANVETDEYVLAGEKLGEWTQLVTVQRLTLAQPATSDAFVAYFKQRVADDGATLDVLSESRAASVFAVRFPRSDRNEEQVMICLAFVAAGKPVRLNIVQYAIKPTCCPVVATTARIKSWRDRFLAQARMLGAASPPPNPAEPLAGAGQ